MGCKFLPNESKLEISIETLRASLSPASMQEAITWDQQDYVVHCWGLYTMFFRLIA